MLPTPLATEVMSNLRFQVKYEDFFIAFVLQEINVLFNESSYICPNLDEKSLLNINFIPLLEFFQLFYDYQR